ncbi:sirohydrochlorin chelatase [Rummeliibacillus pycnus]|uniref:sirohydrochlorin chelatase n=1 Tax=Rummeliibacillus pycnus TaxID=101070 RepID=UPI000C9CEA85|nr:sirohydrochlorin chelatase [Rummeliibacillus pycnus]
MQAVIYIAHGTRVQEGVDEARAFVERAKKYIPIKLQEICFLELVEPTIEQTIERCIQKGASEIALVPILLLTANHAKKDIPAIVKPIERKYPHIVFSYGKPFGIHPSLITQIYERIEEQTSDLAPDAEILLIGRGSSDPGVVRDFAEIATRFKLRYGVRHVEIAFLYGNGPKFSSFVEKIVKSPNKQRYIVPYLLFQGLLRKHIEKELEGIQLVTVCNSLGYGDRVLEVLVERTREAIKALQTSYAS